MAIGFGFMRRRGGGFKPSGGSHRRGKQRLGLRKCRCDEVPTVPNCGHMEKGLMFLSPQGLKALCVQKWVDNKPKKRVFKLFKASDRQKRGF